MYVVTAPVLSLDRVGVVLGGRPIVRDVSFDVDPGQVVAVVGAGYWGPNLVRNFQSSPAFRLRWLCDLDVDRVEQVRLDSERDRWFTAQQALEYGFVDHVVARVTQMPNGSGPAPA